MNLPHRWICSSARWKETVKSEILPWALEGVELGPNLLEVGPGYGVTTEQLQHRVDHMTCVEVDPSLAQKLRRKTEGSNVTVLCESAAEMSLPSAAFDSAVCFTMLHHVPSAALQDQLLTEVARVLRPGGVFAGTDSRYSRRFGLLHLFDTMVLVDPSTFPERLRTAGFKDVQVDVSPGRFRFRACKAENAAAAPALASAIH